MKILIFSDVHWGRYSSIVRTIGTKYSSRLEMLIKSMNWVNEVAIQRGCGAMICGGDMMDKSICTDDELTALNEVVWSNMPCFFLVGNHESSVKDLKYSSVKALESKNRIIVSNPFVLDIENTQIHFVPYVTEDSRKDLKDYLTVVNKNKKQVIISHNDIQGIKYGGIESKLGFSIDEISNACDLCLNGHLHNQARINSKIINVGSLSAHNFTNDSFNYKYGCWILDTDTLDIEFIENPYAYNFIQVEITSEKDIDNFKVKYPNCVVGFKCKDSLVGKLKEKIKTLDLVESKVTSIREVLGEGSSEVVLESVDAYEKFTEFMTGKLGNSDLVKEEIMEVIR